MTNVIQENSQYWLTRAAIAIGEQVLEPAGLSLSLATGLPIIDNIIVSTGLPSSRAFHARGRAIGQCFDPQYSENGEIQIFISPTVTDEVDVLGVLTHEMLHAVCGQKAGHGPKFEAAAHKVGLMGPATMTTVGDDLSIVLAEIAADLGEYPHPKLDITIQPKATTRLLKIICINQFCPYFYTYGKACVYRATWQAVKDASPICGHCKARMGIVKPSGKKGAGGMGGGAGGEEEEKEEEEIIVIDPDAGGGSDSDGSGEKGESEDDEAGKGDSDSDAEAGEGDSASGGDGDSDEGESPSELTDAKMAEIEAEMQEALDASGYEPSEATEQGSDEHGTEDGQKQFAGAGGAGGTVKLGVGRVKQRPAHPVEMDCDCPNCVEGRKAAGL